MTDEETLDFLLDNREWHRFECKRAAVLPAKLLETAVALANAEGGCILVGMEDPDKAKRGDRLIGIGENPDYVSEFLKLLEKEIDPPLLDWKKFELPIVNREEKPDQLLAVLIQKSNDVHSLKKGETLQRRGNQNVRLTANEIIRIKYEKGAVKFEDEPSGLRTLNELNRSLLRRYQQDTQSQNENDWQFLKDNGLALTRGNDFELTHSGALIFAENPSVVLRRKCGIKIARYAGVKPMHTEAPNLVGKPLTVEGPFLRQIEGAINYFRNVVSTSKTQLVGSTFRSSFLIPEWAFQEAVTNAVIHRNYFLQEDIQIRFFDDRVEVESPGTYPGHITVNNIRVERYARNPMILRALNRFQSSPNLDIGEGVDRMFRVMREYNLYDPLYLPPSLKPNSVSLILFNLQKIEYWDTVGKYVDEHYRITNSQARKITGISDTLKMSRLLKSWVSRGLLEKVGGDAKRIVFYTKPGLEAPSSLFSGGVDNKRWDLTK